MSDLNRRIEAIWRIESPRLIATLARLVRDVGLAEELAQDAFVLALEQWPVRGVPDNPGGWLTATAKHKAVDAIRREQNLRAKYARLAADPDAAEVKVADPQVAADQPIGDELLALLFVACHPVLPPSSRAALTLRLLGGLTTEEIARAYLVPSATIGQRISRAKRTLSEAHVPFAIPEPEERPARLRAVLEVLYLIFNEGYAATSGDRWLRPDLAEEAMRLGRVLAGLMPREPEIGGLVALMELQASRFPARVDSSGSVVLLEHQDRSALGSPADPARSRHAGPRDRPRPAARPVRAAGRHRRVHARASNWDATDWSAIVALYDALAQIAPSPVVEVNRAVAVGFADGPEAALSVLDGVATTRGWPATTSRCRSGRRPAPARPS